LWDQLHALLPERIDQHRLGCHRPRVPDRVVVDKLVQAGQIAARGLPAPVQVGRRWVVERSHAWLNAFGKLRWCTERRQAYVVFWLALDCVG